MDAINFTPVSTPAIEAPKEPNVSVGENYQEYKPLFERFGLSDTKDERVSRNLETIWKWAKSHSETPDKESILWQVTKLTHKLGDVGFGSAPYSKVLNYVSTYNQMVEAENRLKEMENG